MPIGVEQQSQLKTASSPQRRGDFRYTGVGVSHEGQRDFSENRGTGMTAGSL